MQAPTTTKNALELLHEKCCRKYTENRRGRTTFSITILIYLDDVTLFAFSIYTFAISPCHLFWDALLCVDAKTKFH